MSVLEMARRVLQVRLWQHVVNEEMKRGRFRIPIHAAFGHEALAVALDETMREDDQLALTHRNMAYQFARARAFAPVHEEYLLQTTGAGGGRLGSMNLTQPERGIAYTSSILGNNLPVACGLALAHKLRGTGAVVFALTGDGAMEEGAFYETLLFARSHRLPLVVVVENNDHSLASKIAEQRSPVNIRTLGAALDIPCRNLAGNELGAYSEAFAEARAEAAGGPVVMEALVRTFCNHAGPTPGWATDPRHLSLGDGLLIEPTSEDPVYLAMQALGAEAAEVIDSLLKLAPTLSDAVEEVACLNR